MVLRHASAMGHLAHPSIPAQWVGTEAGGESCTWEARLEGEEAFCRDPWRSGLLPLKPAPAGAPAGHEVALRAGGWPEGVPREPWRDMDFGVEVLEVRLLSANARCPAIRIYPQLW